MSRVPALADLVPPEQANGAQANGSQRGISGSTPGTAGNH
jgi:hypothetical protein